MHRLFNGTQADVPPAPPAVEGTPGYPTEGDPSTGAVPSEIDSYQAFTIQKEISHVVEESGIPLDKTNNGQLYAALNMLYQAKLGYIPVKQNEGNDTETHAVSLGWRTRCSPTVMMVGSNSSSPVPWSATW